MQNNDLVSHFAANLGLAAVMVALTVVVHFIGLAALSLVLRRGTSEDSRGGPAIGRRLLVIVAAVMGLFGVHAIEIWAWAALYRFGLGAFEEFEVSLYFSTVAFSTVGFGDVLLPRSWRLLGAIQGMNGFVLIGWSTAFLISVMGRIRALEHEWLDRH